MKEQSHHLDEWPTSDDMKTVPTGQGNFSGINGRIRIEPCFGAFDKLQSEPLKACMTALASLLPKPFEFRHSWKHLTIQRKDSDDYILWVAIDHLYGTAKTFINNQLLNEKDFEQAFRHTYEAMMCKKSIGAKGKGKDKDNLERPMSPKHLLRAVGLSGDGNGSYLKGGYLTLKATSPFLFEVRAIDPSLFAAKYDEHLKRIAERIMHPIVMQ